MKKSRFLLLVSLLLLVACVSVATIMTMAAEKVVFVNQSSGNDAYDGSSQSNAVKTLNAAFNKLSSGGGTIVLTSDYTLSANYNTPSFSGNVTLTSVYKGTNFGAKLKITGECLFGLYGNMTFRDLTVYQTRALTFVANFREILFDDGFVVTSSGSKNVSVVGGYWEPMDMTLDQTLDSYPAITPSN